MRDITRMNQALAKLASKTRALALACAAVGSLLAGGAVSLAFAQAGAPSGTAPAASARAAPQAGDLLGMWSDDAACGLMGQRLTFNSRRMELLFVGREGRLGSLIRAEVGYGPPAAEGVQVTLTQAVETDGDTLRPARRRELQGTWTFRREGDALRFVRIVTRDGRELPRDRELPAVWYRCQ